MVDYQFSFVQELAYLIEIECCVFILLKHYHNIIGLFNK
jgi:hypothetical protein